MNNLAIFKNFSVGDKLLLEYVDDTTVSKFSGENYDLGIIEKFAYNADSKLLLGIRIVAHRNKMIDFIWLDPVNDKTCIVNLSRNQE